MYRKRPLSLVSSGIPPPTKKEQQKQLQLQQKSPKCVTETTSILSVNTTTSSNISLPLSQHSSSENSSTISSNNSKSTRNVKSAVHGKSIPAARNNLRAATAKTKKQPSPPNLPKDREQGKFFFSLYVNSAVSIIIINSCNNISLLTI